MQRHEEKHYRLGEPIADLFEKEKTLMIPFNTIPFDTARYESRRVTKQGLIKFSQCYYSVSPKYVGETITLKIMASELEIYNKDLAKKITSHPRLFKEGQESIHYIDFIDILKLRPSALKYSGIYSLLPASWQKYLSGLKKEEFRKAFEILKTILLEEGLAFAGKVLEETLEHSTLSSEAIYVTYKRMKENSLLYEGFISLPADLPSYSVDTAQYDSLMGSADL